MSPRRWRPTKAELQAENARLKSALAVQVGGEARPGPDELLRLVESGSDGCFLLDDDLVIQYLNEGAQRLFGCTPDSALGKPIGDFLSVDILRAHFQQMHALRSGARGITPRRLSVEARQADGSRLRLEVTLAPRRYTGSSGWVLLLRNLAALQAVLETLDAVEHRYHALAEVVPVSIFRTDAMARCLYVSQRWTELTGFGMLDSLGDGWRSVIFPADQERVFRELDEWDSTGGPLRSEHRLRHADGNVLWVLTQVAAERDSGGRLLGYVGAITDITPQKHLEDALRAAEEQFQVIFRENPFAMWVYDAETLFFLAVNDVVVNDYGWTREEFLRRKITDIRPPEDIPAVLEVARNRPPGWYRNTQWRHRYKDGRLVEVETVSHPVTFNGREAILVTIRPPEPVPMP